MFQKYVIQLNWVSCQIGKEKTLSIFGTGYTLCKICLIGILQPQFCRGHYSMLELAAMCCFLKICNFEGAISKQLSHVYKEKSFLDVCRKIQGKLEYVWVQRFKKWNCSGFYCAGCILILISPSKCRLSMCVNIINIIQ